MKITKLTDISIDPGAPCPKILSSDLDLYLLFYKADIDEGITDTIRARDIINDKGIAIVRFKHYLKYTFGSPSNETLQGHPLYKYGLEFYAGQFVSKSKWIDELIEIDRIHPYHNPNRFKDYKHYIFTFHDNIFECVAKEYEVEYKMEPMYDIASSILHDIFVNEVM